MINKKELALMLVVSDYYDHKRGTLADAAKALSRAGPISTYGGMWYAVVNQIWNGQAPGYGCELSNERDSDGVRRVKIVEK